MNSVSRKIANILQEEFTSTTVSNLIAYCAEQVGKSSESLEPKDIPQFSKRLLQSVFLLLDTEKTARIRRQLQELASASGFEPDHRGNEPPDQASFYGHLIQRWFHASQ
ncbi:MAG: hypothetical protein L0Y56_19890 [Nitrospira sp.]|nr:hypothetical protein [Nitrospira sp.]